MTGKSEGAEGVKGLTSVGGFENTASPHAPRSAPKWAVKSGSFEETTSATQHLDLSTTATQQSGDRPVEILFKPRPAYTDDARRNQVEGEVLLEVLFAASGKPSMIRLVRGLGHGLDESAIAAAGSIRFRPAERAGVPNDSTAIVHILFQLAY